MKRLYALIAIILVFLGFAYVDEGGVGKPAKTAKPTVGILQLMSHPALDAIHRGIIHGLAENGYHAGKNVKIDFQNAQNDQSNLMTMSNRFVNEDADAVIGIATPSAQALAMQPRKFQLFWVRSLIQRGLVWLKTTNVPVTTLLVFLIKHP